MFMKNYNLTFFTILFVASVLSISFNSLFFTWSFMELNLLVFVPILLVKSNFMKEQPSLALKYFLAQVISSIFLLMSMMLMNFNFVSLMSLNVVLISALLLKAGLPPFHYWVPPVIVMCNPLQAFLILTIQKIIPLFILSLMIGDLTMKIIVMSSLFGSMMGFNQNSILKILAFSSMVHSSWMLTNLYINLLSSFFYFLVYLITSYYILSLMNKSSTKTISEILHSNKTFQFLIVWILSILTLSGTPPFIGFFSKVFILMHLMKSKVYLISFLLIMSSTISFYFYSRLIITTSIFTMNTYKNFNLYYISTISTLMIVLINLSFLTIFWWIS